eukprot:3329498-Prymnesium_polylepis.1
MASGPRLLGTSVATHTLLLRRTAHSQGRRGRRALGEPAQRVHEPDPCLLYTSPSPRDAHES